MNFLKLTLVVVYIACFIVFIKAQEIKLNATYGEIKRKCEVKNQNNLTKAHIELYKHFKSIKYGIYTELIEKSYVEIKKLLFEKCITEESKLLIANLLDNALLCFDENEQPSASEKKKILSDSLIRFCTTRMLPELFYITHFNCAAKAQRELINCLKDPNNILSSSIIDILYPLPVKLTEEECEFSMRQFDCYNNAIEDKCEWSISNDHKIMMNEIEPLVGCPSRK